MSKRVDLCPQDYSSLCTGFWTVFFRSPKEFPIEMRTPFSAFGHSIGEAILNAREHARSKKEFEWNWPITKVVYHGEIDLLLMAMKTEVNSVVYDDGLWD